MMKFKIYISQTFFTLEQHLLDFFTSKERGDLAVFISSHFKVLDVEFLKNNQALVIPYFDNSECHEKISKGLLGIINENKIGTVEIHAPVTNFSVSILGVEMVRHLFNRKECIKLHFWDGDIEDVIYRSGLIHTTMDFIKTLHEELRVIMSNLAVIFSPRQDNRNIFYVCHYIFDTTYHLVRPDLLKKINIKEFSDALIKNTKAIDSECIKRSDRKIHLMLIQALGIPHDVYKKIATYASIDTTMITYSNVNNSEHKLRQISVGKYDKQYVSLFFKLLSENNKIQIKDNLVIHNLNSDGSVVTTDIPHSTNYNTFLEDKCSLFLLDALGALPEKLGGYPDIYLLAFPVNRIKFLILHENMDYASTQKYHHLLIQAGYPDDFFYSNEADSLLSNSGKLDILVTMSASLGDCMFALAAVKALRKVVTNNIIFMTYERYCGLVKHSPHVDKVIALENQAEHAMLIYRQTELSLSATFITHLHVLSPLHMIDACLKSININAQPDQLDMDIIIGAEECSQVDNFIAQHQLANENVVLLHANIGDPNRTWSAENWNLLAEKFIQPGWRVVAIGSTNNKFTATQVHSFSNPLIINAVDKFSIVESIYLMRKCQLLVAADSGPVALAGASDIAIVSLYSIVSGDRRIAYRHGRLGWNALCINLKCHFGHCMRLAIDSKFCNNVLKRSIKQTRLNEWCPLGDTQGEQVRYSCMNNYHADVLFKEITKFLSSDQYVKQSSI